MKHSLVCSWVKSFRKKQKSRKCIFFQWVGIYSHGYFFFLFSFSFFSFGVFFFPCCSIYSAAIVFKLISLNHNFWHHPHFTCSHTITNTHECQYCFQRHFPYSFTKRLPVKLLCVSHSHTVYAACTASLNQLIHLSVFLRSPKWKLEWGSLFGTKHPLNYLFLVWNVFFRIYEDINVFGAATEIIFTSFWNDLSYCIKINIFRHSFFQLYENWSTLCFIHLLWFD